MDMQRMGFGKHGRQRRARSIPAGTTWVLIAGFLLQPVLAYLVTPIATHDSAGRQVVVCTLQGTKQVTLDLPQLADNADTEHCSALKLYQMASSAQISRPPMPASVSLYVVALLDQTAERAHRTLHFSAYSTRAPPSIS